MRIELRKISQGFSNDKKISAIRLQIITYDDHLYPMVVSELGFTYIQSYTFYNIDRNLVNKP